MRSRSSPPSAQLPVRGFGSAGRWALPPAGSASTAPPTRLKAWPGARGLAPKAPSPRRAAAADLFLARRVAGAGRAEAPPPSAGEVAPPSPTFRADAIYEIFPFIMKYLPGPHQKALSAAEFILNFAKKEIVQHKEAQSLHNPRDFIDFYLFEMEKSKNDPNSTFDEDNLTHCISDLFFTGADTTAVSLKWALLLMAIHLDIQDKVHKEIQDVLCSSRSICYGDRKNLPYTNAVIHEILRYKYISLFGVPRQCTKDVYLHGFLIPKLAKQYGSIYSLWGGNIIVLSAYETVKEALVDHPEAFADRPLSAFLLAIIKRKGIVFSNGHTWFQQRRLTVVTMRKLGLGKKSLESQIQAEVERFLEDLGQTKGQPFDPSLYMTHFAGNVISMVVFGQSFPTEDKEFAKLMEAMHVFERFLISFPHLIYEIFPFIMKYLPGPHQKALSAAEFILNFAKKEIVQHKEAQNLQNPRDFIDFYLLEMEKSKNDPNSTLDEDNLTHTITDLFFAGADSTAVSLKWALLLMAIHLDIQDKVHKEIQDVLCSSRSICYGDRKNLPYTNAVIHEIMRYKYISLFGVPRQCTKDVYLHGFLIPKGTIILQNMLSLLFDSEQWETPEKFNPNHFLDKEGHFVTKEAFLPFGAGARICLGELFTRIEFFTFFTNLLRKFRVQAPEGVEKLSEKPIIGVTVYPSPYKICLVPRSATS
ncbi:cytochrome P450 2J2-like [Erythrolamprus reginae]|uniref:cytochrome P450 2J2-like n=1 Tax=Erythrolamprus reginae TaxID=121349 RepID=UPI00396C396A